MDIVVWLRSLGLGKYEAAFRDNEIDETVLPSLTEEHLKQLGVTALGHRVKLLDAIAALRSGASAPGPPGDLKSPLGAPSASPEDRAERRQVTVMFSDLVGSTALSARMDPEDLREIISAYQKCVAETVQRFGGFVAKYMGDGVLVYFGYPQAHEDDAERAVRAGLELIAAVGALKTYAPLQIRVGIATGLVVVGDLIGLGETQERGIVGETPNLAARLQAMAEPNEVVVADSTRKLVGNLFELQDLGAQDLKGIVGPVRAWAALRPSSVESRFDAFHASGLTELVGREEELELLLRRWSKAKSGEGQVVLLSGEPGIGKSRLTAALLERLAAEPHSRLRNFCSPQHIDSALYPTIGQIERAAGFRHDDAPQAKLDKLDTLLARDAKFGTLYLREGDELRLVATHDVPPAFVETQRHTPFRPAPEGMLDAVMKTGRTVHLTDLAETRSYIERDPRIVDAVEVGGIRTVVGVPLLRDNELIGLIGIYRQEVRPFAEKQIALLTNFAAQAVIAIENARLLNELRQSLEQQTATSQVLQVISSSPGELEPVFASMLENAVRICDATFGNIYRWDGENLHLVAAHNTPPAFAEARRRSPDRPSPKSSVGQMIETKAVVHVADAREQPSYAERDPASVAAVELGGARTVLAVPMLKEKELMGAFTLSRQEVRPFTEKQIALVTNFASQAVIAIENTRLLNELRERTEEVEKLNQHLEHRVTDQVDEIERMSRLRRFLPPQVADLIVASGTEKQLESHRREITALFCDLRGFTGFTESADAEDVMALLRDYHAAIGEIIIKYNGTLERYAGDGVMVVFNDPVPVENPALQAVLMALEVRDAIGALTEKWRRWGHDIGFGIGIAHGFATLGTIGFEGRFDYAAIGTVSNVASRLCDEAKPGQILISPRVLTKVENAVTVEPVGEFELKGMRRPLAAYNVVGAVSPKA